MTARVLLVILSLVLAAPAPAAQEVPVAPEVDAAPVRFTSVHVFVDPQAQPLAAYQLEFIADPRQVTLVGIEGGEHPAFAEPPYYDAAALNRSRVILAAFNTSTELPQTKTRVATLHLRVVGAEEPNFSARLEVAGNPAGEPIPAAVSVAEGVMR